MGRGYGSRGRGWLYTYGYTVTTGMTSALRWAAMTAILIFHNCEGQRHQTVSTDHNFGRERRAEADSNRGSSAYQPNALPLGQTAHIKFWWVDKIYILRATGNQTDYWTVSNPQEIKQIRLLPFIGSDVTVTANVIPLYLCALRTGRTHNACGDKWRR